MLTPVGWNSMGVADVQIHRIGRRACHAAAGASAKTLKVTKSELAQHLAVDVVQHRVPPTEPVDPAILHAAPATVP